MSFLKFCAHGIQIILISTNTEKNFLLYQMTTYLVFLNNILSNDILCKTRLNYSTCEKWKQSCYRNKKSLN